MKMNTAMIIPNAVGIFTDSHKVELVNYMPHPYGNSRAIIVAGPTVWNSLPDFVRDPSISTDSFRRLLKTYLFA